ncbi:MAG TPA: helix-turn-helix domain-containing protein [Nevskiaceae bacterium]
MKNETHPSGIETKLANGLMLTDLEVAELFGTATQTIRDWRWKGTGPAYIKLGPRMVRYRAEDIKAFIEGHRMTRTHAEGETLPEG